MIRIIGYFIAFAAFITAVVWLNNNPGFVEFNWFDFHIKTPIAVFIAAIVILLIVSIALWRLVRGIMGAPDAFGLFMNGRKRRKGYDALSKGIIAAGSGDVKAAHKFANIASSKLVDEPLTLLLKAQTAQLEGNKAQAQEAFEKMVKKDATKMLGLRGMFVEAERNDDSATAKIIAMDAVAHDGSSKWALNALFDLQTSEGDWGGALNSLLMVGRLSGADAQQIKRKRAVLLTAEAQNIELSNAERALELTLEARNLAPELVPATLLSAKLLLAKGSIRKAHKLLEKCWRLAPHPDLGKLFAMPKDGEKPKALAKRVQNFATKAGIGNAQNQTQADIEAAVLVARTLIDQSEWSLARKSLENAVANDPSARVCTLMAKIEQGEFANKGLVTEWLARAQNAPSDPMWLADGHIASQWAPISPVTGALDAYEWKLPEYNLAQVEADLAANILLEHHENETQAIQAQEQAMSDVKAEQEQALLKLKKQNDDDKADAKKDVTTDDDGGDDSGSDGGSQKAIETVAAKAKPIAEVSKPIETVVKPSEIISEVVEKASFQPADASPQKYGNEKSLGLAISSKKGSSPFRSSSALRTASDGEQVNPVHRPDDPGTAGENEGVNFQPKEKIGYYTNN